MIEGLNSLIDQQIENENKFSRKSIYKRLSKQIPETEIKLLEKYLLPWIQENAKFIKDSLKFCDLVFKKLCFLNYLDFPIISSCLYKLLMEKPLIENFDYSDLTRMEIQQTVNKVNKINELRIQKAIILTEKLIDELIDIGYLVVDYFKNPKTKEILGIREIRFKYCFNNDYFTEEELKDQGFALPLIIPPRKLKDNCHLGYYTDELNNNYLILNSKNQIKQDIRLDFINLINKFAYVIDKDVIEFCDNNWSCFDNKDLEQDCAKYRMQLKNFRNFNFQIEYKVDNVKDCPIYFTHKFDSRGRVYDYAYLYNPQGNSYQKAMLRFFNTEVCNNEIEV